MKLIHKLTKTIYDGDRIYFVANKKTNTFGYYTKDEVEDMLLNVGSNNLIIFSTKDELDIETEIRGL